MNTARGEALRMVARRGFFSEELREKLEKKGYDSKEINAALLELTELGYLNDEERRARFVERKKKSGHGPASIALQLKVKKAGEVHISFEEEMDCIHNFLEKKHPTWRAHSWQERRGLFAKLQRRGFSSEAIYKILSVS